MTRLASVSHTRWAFYEAMDAEDTEGMANWFETLYHHYQDRGKKIKHIQRAETPKSKGEK